VGCWFRGCCFSIELSGSKALPVAHAPAPGAFRNGRRKRQGAVLNQALSAALFVLLFFLYLIVEVFLAMATYMYLNLYHPYTFGSLIGLARGLLNSFTTYLEQLSPELANRAYATLLGELGPKSVLLLLIGLIVSALARLMIWAVKNALKR
jgi:hypothetical protein